MSDEMDTFGKTAKTLSSSPLGNHCTLYCSYLRLCSFDFGSFCEELKRRFAGSSRLVLGSFSGFGFARVCTPRYQASPETLWSKRLHGSSSFHAASTGTARVQVRGKTGHRTANRR